MHVLVASRLDTAYPSINRLNISLDLREAVSIVVYFGGQILYIVPCLMGCLVKTIESIKKALLVLYVVLRLSEYAHAYGCERYAHSKQADEFWPFKLSQIQNITPLSPFSSTYGYSSV